jgi:hypothetical protein
LHRYNREGRPCTTFETGRVTKMVVYWERETGLADLGLAPEDAAGDQR